MQILDHVLYRAAPPPPCQPPAWAGGPVSAGFPSPAADFEQERIWPTEFLIRNPLSSDMIRMSTDALSGRGILKGDILVFDRSASCEPGDIVIADHEGRFIARILGDRRLLSANPLFQEIELGDMESIFVAKVVGVMRRMG